jgi:hypothetical protein
MVVLYVEVRKVVVHDHRAETLDVKLSLELIEEENI